MIQEWVYSICFIVDALECSYYDDKKQPFCNSRSGERDYRLTNIYMMECDIYVLKKSELLKSV